VYRIEAAKIALALKIVEHPIEERLRLGRFQERRRQINRGNQRQAQC